MADSGAPPQDTPPQDAAPQQAAPQDAAPQQAASGTPSGGPSRSRLPPPPPSPEQIQTMLTNELARKLGVAEQNNKYLTDRNTTLTRENTALAADNAKCPTERATAVTTAINNAYTYPATIWRSMEAQSVSTISQLCKTYTTSGPSTGQVISQLEDVNLSKMCNGGKIVYTPLEPNNISPIFTDNSIANTTSTILKYCNDNATSSTSYQKELCVCNQIGPRPILHMATASSGGVLGVGGSTTTGYYCMASPSSSSGQMPSNSNGQMLSNSNGQMRSN